MQASGLLPHGAVPVMQQGDADASQAHTGSEAADQVLQGLAHTSLPYYGVQFHPESIGTAFGFQLLQNFHDLTVEYHGLPEQAPMQLPRQLPGQSATFESGETPARQSVHHHVAQHQT